METLSTLGQVPLMFLGGFLTILAVAVVWTLGRIWSRDSVTDL